VARATPRRTFCFQFLTPTTFRSRNISQPLPLPGSVFGHYRARWSAFAPRDWQMAIDFHDAGLVTEDLLGSIESFAERGRDYEHLWNGFVGRCTYRAHTAGRDGSTVLAPFCGTGSNTTKAWG